MSSSRDTHKRDTTGLRSAPRCSARTRRGGSCNAPAVSGKGRCRMHGGAKGSGAPKGNRNALKNGFWTREAIAERRLISQLIRESRETLRKIE